MTAGIAALAAPTAARAAVYTVTGTADPGTCVQLQCTGVQAALDAAKAAAGADEIDLQAITYTTSNGFTISDPNGVTVVGSGAGQTTLAAGQGVRVVANSGTATLEHLKVSGGNVSQGSGGGILNTGKLTLDHVEVSGNQALNGAGIANQGALTIGYSLIASNVASGDGGGIFVTDPVVAGPPVPATVDVHDSTIAFNTAQIRSGGGGVDLRGAAGNRVTLQRVTVARNTGGNPDLGAGGILISGTGNVLQAAATIVADNANVTGTASNCAGTQPQDGGYNVEDGADCGFAAITDRQGVDPGLALSLTLAGGETAVLPLSATSPAVDLGPACSGVTDQRGVPRPQGAACDAGAYEYDPPPTVVVDSGPSGTTTDAAPQFAFHSSDLGVRFQCRLDGPTGPGTFAPCTSPQGFGTLAPGSYTFVLEAIGPGGKVTTTSRSFIVEAAPTPTATPTPKAVFHKNVVVKPVSGTVKVKLPGTNKFVDLDVTQNVPLGSTIDVRHGKIALTSVPKSGGKPQTALFYGGVFKLTQPGGITQLQLTEPLAACPRRHAAAAAAASKKPKTRRLWGDGHGAFRTKGQYSAATVRGTKWLVQDSCAGTLTRVVRGVVSVRDEVRHKTVTLRAGKKYLAKPRR